MGNTNSESLSGDLQKKFPSFESTAELQEFFVSCELSRIIYYDHRDIPKHLETASHHPWFTPQSFQLTLPNAPQKLMFLRDQHKLYVVLCGTQSWNDWLVDLAVTLKPFPMLPGTLIHHGFSSRFEKTPWRAIAAAATKLQRENKKKVKIILCGHSLAGAIAQIISCCLLLHYKSQFDLHCYTFGQPLIGEVTQFINQNEWQSKFHCFIHVRDPIPFLFRQVPRMAPFGTLVMLSEKEENDEYSVDFSVITPELFRRHQWRTEDFSNFGLRNIKNLAQVVQESVAMKKYHSIDNYYQLLTDIFRGNEKLIQIPTKHKKTILEAPIAVVPYVRECNGVFLDNGDLQVIIKGENLAQMTVASLQVQSKSNEPDDSKSVVIRSFNIHEKGKDSIETRFIITKGTKLNSSKGIITLTNYFTLLRQRCFLPFNTVWLVGKTGAGKSQLRIAIENSVESSTANSDTKLSVPVSHVVPEVHEEYERSYEQNRVHYYEFHGFTDFAEEDSKSFLRALDSHPPKLILLIINATETIRETERNKLREFIAEVDKMENLDLWFVFTHYSMVDDRIRDSVISKIKKELQIQGDAKNYRIDSVAFRSGPVEIPSQGVIQLREDIEEYLRSIVNTSILEDNSHYQNLIEISRALLNLAWRNKRNVIAGITTSSTMLYYLYKLQSRM